MRTEFKFGVKGFFRFDAVNKVTGKSREIAPWQSNLITNQGLDALATEADVMTWFHVGTSATEPQITDTWLGAFVASTDSVISDVTGVSGIAPHYGYRRITRRFDYGDAAGNLQECAVGWSPTTGTAFMHELIRDGVGAAISISVLSDEYLDFTYELRYIAPTSDSTGTCDISGVTYNFTTRALNVTDSFIWASFIGKTFYEYDLNETYHRAYTGNIGLITDSVPGGTTATGTTDVTSSTYAPGDYYLDFTVSAGPTLWNVAGEVIRSVVLSCRGNRWQTEYDKVSDGTGISKSASNGLSLDFRVSWMRAA